MKKPKNGKNEDANFITFYPGISESKTVFKYQIRQNLRPMIFLKTACLNLHL